MTNATKNQRSQKLKGKASTEKSRVVLPGLYASDIYINLRNMDFACSGPRRMKHFDLVKWECKKEEGSTSYVVEIEGNAPNEITLIQATGQNYGRKSTNSALRPFLGYVASTPYDGASQLQARDWAHKNIGANKNRKFGKAKFELISSGRTRMLEITPTD